VTAIESWPTVPAFVLDAKGVAGATVALLGVPSGSRLLELPMREGRWLTAGDTLGVVLNRAEIARGRRVGLGDSVAVRVAGRRLVLRVVGITRELAPTTVLYLPASSVAGASGLAAGTTRSVRIAGPTRADPTRRLLAQRLESELAHAGLQVSGLQRLLDVKQGILDHLVIILSILSAASVIVVFVGGLGLISTLVLGVVRRTREIGVLGAIGATPGVIARQIWIESMAMGVLSWICANVLAAPLSWGLEIACGSIFLKTPLDFYLSARASLAWLLLVAALASLCSLYPAGRAARLTIRDALSHE
jgi:putative ABC transport system permease protein